MGTATDAAPVGVLSTETAARAGTGTQLLKSADDVRPSPHARQTEGRNAPTALDAKPVAHEWHDDADAWPLNDENVPFGHNVHVMLLLAPSAVEKVPIGQYVQDELPLTDEKLP